MPKTTSSKATSSEELKAHKARLVEMRRAAQLRLDTAAEEYGALQEDGGDVGAGDDEGGGEADVTTAERDRLRAAIRVETEAVEAIDAALERSTKADWNRCVSCGNEIGGPRLEAIPSTDRCVTCKANSTFF